MTVICTKLQSGRLRIMSRPSTAFWYSFTCRSALARADPKEIKAACDKRNVNCIIISSVYDHIFPVPEDYTFPLFVIDNEPYKTDNYQKYGEAFYKSLIHIDDENRYCSYHYFCDGEYVCSFDLLTDFDKSKAVVADVQR